MKTYKKELDRYLCDSCNKDCRNEINSFSIHENTMESDYTGSYLKEQEYDLCETCYTVHIKPILKKVLNAKR